MRYYHADRVHGFYWYGDGEREIIHEQSETRHTSQLEHY